MEWSAGSPLKDTGFDSGSFDHWKVGGDATAVSVERTEYGQRYLSMKGAPAANVSQQVDGLTPGQEYVASVWVNVTGRKKAILHVEAGNLLNEQTSIEESKVFNYTDNTDSF